MKPMTPPPPGLAQIKPLVRYVDAEQAIVDTHFRLKPRFSLGNRRFPKRVRILLEIETESGFHDEKFERVELHRGCGMVQMKILVPQRWWPAGMGEQTLYTVTVTVLHGRHIIDKHRAMVGFTSVRSQGQVAGPLPEPTAWKSSTLMVNSQPCEIHTIVPVDQVHEKALLPVSGESLILVRDHYGPDNLFNAADRAGILMIQCVPIDPNGHAEKELLHQVPRLASHPSLAGWCVASQGRLGRAMLRRLKRLDPTHPVFTEIPQIRAA